jgi:hypothetical protein
MDFVVVFLQCKPPDVLIDSIHVPKTGVVVIEGRTSNQDSIGQFIDNLSDQSITAGYIQNAEIKAMGSPTDDPRFPRTRVVPFRIALSTFSRDGRYRSIRNSVAFTPAAPGAPGGAGGIRGAVSRVMTRGFSIGGLGGGMGSDGGAKAPAPAQDK